MEFKIRPIGYIKTKYIERTSTPSQGAKVEGSMGTIVMEADFVEGIRDLKKGTKISVIFYFHLSKGYKLITPSRASPFPIGVFSIRSPDRPNCLGVSEVTITDIIDNKISFEGADMLNGTPVIDIKPSMSNFR